MRKACLTFLVGLVACSRDATAPKHPNDCVAEMAQLRAARGEPTSVTEPSRYVNGHSVFWNYSSGSNGPDIVYSFSWGEPFEGCLMNGPS
jgi:hypothetical protein